MCVFQLMDALSQETGLELDSKDESLVGQVTDRVNQVLIFGPGNTTPTRPSPPSSVRHETVRL